MLSLITLLCIHRVLQEETGRIAGKVVQVNVMNKVYVNMGPEMLS